VKSSAIISKDGLYRYWLDRFWDGPTNPLVFCMLNGSTADAEKDDPTIRRCIGFAKREGMTGLIVVNLFGFRSTDFKKLKEANDPEGPENEYYQTLAVKASRGRVVCAWGKPGRGSSSAIRFRLLCQLSNIKMVCLGKNKDETPKHPLYIKADQPFIDF
jgi:hypothetical protein